MEITDAQSTKSYEDKRRGFKYTLPWLALIIVVTVAGALLIDNRNLASKISNLEQNASIAVLTEIDRQRILNALEKHILLSDTETPEIYLIEDVDNVKAKYGDFFEDAKVNDKLIVFKKKAILFRESDNIIINVGPIIYAPASTSSVESMD